MSSSYLWVANVVPTVLLLLCEVAALVLVLVAGRGPGRVLGAIGVGLLILVALAQSAYGMMVPVIMAATELGIAQFRWVSAGAYSVIALIIAAGLILMAIGAGRAGEPADPGSARGGVR